MSNKTDKELALELTKAYLEHLSIRATSNRADGSHASVESTKNAYKHFYSVISGVEKRED